MKYGPGQWIPPTDNIALLKARYICGFITLEELERGMAHCVRGLNYAAPPGHYGSEMRELLRVTVES